MGGRAAPKTVDQLEAEADQQRADEADSAVQADHARTAEHAADDADERWEPENNAAEQKPEPM